MADLPNDMWAVGALVARVFTCANPGVQEVFPLAAKDQRAVKRLRRGGDVRLQRGLRDALLRSQARWVATLSLAAILYCTLCLKFLMNANAVSLHIAHRLIILQSFREMPLLLLRVLTS